MNITIPELALVVLVGPSGSGKSTFARKHFKATEILSSDFFRGMIADDPSEQGVSGHAFELLHSAAAKRLAFGRFTVLDATHVQPDSRKASLELARRHHVAPVAIVFDLPIDQCNAWDDARPDRHVGPKVVQKHNQLLQNTLKKLIAEGFRTVHVLSSVEQIQAAVVVREPLNVNRRHEHGPFDIIGDVHGCLDELKTLLARLGWTIDDENIVPPLGRKAIFVGDLVDRGPDTPGVLALVGRMIAAGQALCVRGNHDDKLLRKLQGRDVAITHGLETSLQQLEGRPPEFIEMVRGLLESLPTHYVLDDGKLVVAHAGISEELQGRISDRVRAFTLYGKTTGSQDEFGLPVRLDWAADYRGRATVIYGHTPTLNLDWINRTICIDTGCVFGGMLTALRYPEQELVSVPALRTYAESKRPLVDRQPEA